MSGENRQLKMIAAERYVRALRSGEGSAARRAEAHLAEGVVVRAGASELIGREAVLAHLTGDWPNTPVYRLGGWSEPIVEGEGVVVRAEFPALGAGARSATLTFSFDAEDRIAEVVENYVAGPQPETSATIPLVVRGLLNNALANGTPVVVSYVSPTGEPELSLRGSVQVFGPTQISIWLRSAEGGLAAAIGANPRITLLYRDSRSRTTIIVKGDGQLVTDETTRNRIYELAPEVEQMHDPGRRGAALLLAVREIRGGTPQGAVLVRP